MVSVSIPALIVGMGNLIIIIRLVRSVWRLMRIQRSLIHNGNVRWIAGVISFYSGTPGSGKSLHVAERLYWWIRSGKPCICNFNIDISRIKGHRAKRFEYVDNQGLTPEYLIQYAQEYISETGAVREGSILLVIDECQLLFNSRDWGHSGRAGWLKFFTMHRHLGYDIILVAQFDRMIDRQIRCLIEYEYIHRKVSNYGWKGKLFSLVFLGNLFVCVKTWYPLKEKVGSEFFRAKKFYYSLYDTYVMFENISGE